MDLKLYNRPTVPSFQPQLQQQQQNPPQRRRDFSNSSTAPMSSTFLFSYENSNDFGSWAPPANGNINNMMNLSNGPSFGRHMGSPPPPFVNSPFHHQGFAPPAPPPQHFPAPGPVGGFQQQQFQNGVLSPLHSPGLSQVLPHMHNSNGNSFALPPQNYHNIPPQSGPLQARNQMPPPPNFAMSFNNSMNMHNGSRENGSSHQLGSYITPPVSAPSSPAPQPPHMMNGSLPPQLPTLSQFGSLQSSIPRTGPRHHNKPLTPPLPKSNLATSTVIRNEPSPVSTNNDQSNTSTTPKPLNPNACSFQPVVQSPAIVSSTPPLQRTATPPTRPRVHPFNPLAHFTPSTCSTPSKEEQAERRKKLNPDVPVFVPSELPARSSPPLNAPTGPASLVPRTNPPSSMPPYRGLPLSPPTGPRADRNKMPPRPNIGLGIGMGAANEIQERGLPPTTPLGPKAMNTPTGPRAERERPLSRAMSSREGFHSRSYSGSEGYNPREKYNKEPPLIPIVALTRIPGIDKLVPTGPAAMLADLPPAAKIPDVPTAPAAMLAKMRAEENGSQNGSDDGSRGRPGFLIRSTSNIYPVRRYSSRVSRGGSRVGDNNSRNASKSRDGCSTPGPIVTEIEITCHESTETFTTDVLTEEPETLDEVTPVSLPVVEMVKEVEEDIVEEVAEVEVAAPITLVQESIEEDEETVNVTVEPLEKAQEPVVELPLEEEEEVLPTVELVASVVEATEVEEEAEPIVAAPVLVEQPVFTTPVEETVETVEIVEESITQPEEVITPEVIPEVIPVSLPSIQIEADDSSRTQIDLENDLDTNVDSFPEFTRPATTPSPRLSEISIKKREVEGDEIVSMMIEDGVVIVPTRDTPSPAAQMWAMAKKEKVKDEDKDTITVVQEETALAQEEPEKEEKKSVEVKQLATDPSSILSARKSKKKKRVRRAQDKSTAASSELPVAPAAPVAEPVAIVEKEVVSEDDVVQTPVKKHSNRSAVVINAILQQSGPNNLPVAFKKDTENDVGFIAESPVPVQQNVNEVEEVVPIQLDDMKSTLEKALPKEEKNSEKKEAQANSEEQDEKDHDGGVRLDSSLGEIEPSKITEIYSDSESIKEQDDEEVSAPLEEVVEVEVKPLNIVKARASTMVVEEEPVVVVEEKSVVVEEVEEEPVVEAAPEPMVIEEPEVAPVMGEKESPVEVEEQEQKVEVEVEELVVAAPEPVVIQEEVVVAVAVEEEEQKEIEEVATIAAEPLASPVVELLMEQLFVPAGEPTVEITRAEIAHEAAVLEPRYTGEVAISINSIIEALASCKDMNSLSGTLATFSRVSKPGTQEERLFKELHHYAAISETVKKDNSDKVSTRSKSSMRSVRSFFKRRADAYPDLLSSTTSRIKAILPPFLSMTAAPAINTIPTSGTITPSDLKNPTVSATPINKSQRPRLLPKMTMSLLHRSFSKTRV